MKTNYYDEDQEFKTASEGDEVISEPLNAIIQHDAKNDYTVTTQETYPGHVHEGIRRKSVSLYDLQQDNFLFKGPAERQIEMSVFLEDEFRRRVDKKNLGDWSEIDKAIPDYAVECARKIINEEKGKGLLYSKAEVKKKAHQWLNKRIRTWLHKYNKETRDLYGLSLLYLFEWDEEGKIIDIALGNATEADLSTDRTNPYHHIPEDVLLAKQGISLSHLIEQTLSIMSKRVGKNSGKHLAILAPLFDNDTDLGNKADLRGLSRIQLNNLYFHARWRFIRIIEGLCPNIRRIIYPANAEIKKSGTKAQKCSFQNPLFNQNEKHGDIIICRRVTGKSESNLNIEIGYSQYKLIRTINYDELANARKTYGNKEGTRLILMGERTEIKMSSISNTSPPFTSSEIEKNQHPKPPIKDPEYDDAA